MVGTLVHVAEDNFSPSGFRNMAEDNFREITSLVDVDSNHVDVDSSHDNPSILGTMCSLYVTTSLRMKLSLILCRIIKINLNSQFQLLKYATDRHGEAQKIPVNSNDVMSVIKFENWVCSPHENCRSSRFSSTLAVSNLATSTQNDWTEPCLYE